MITTYMYKLYQLILSYIPNADITFPNVTNDLLMLPLSFSLTPVAPVASALSLKLNRGCLILNYFTETECTYSHLDTLLSN